MSENRFQLAEALQLVDEEVIRQAGEPWEKHKKGYKGSAVVKAACALLIVTVGLCGIFRGQVSAAAKRIAEQIGSIFGFEEELAPYAEVIGTTETVNGLSVTLQEVILDDSRVIAFLTLDEEADWGDPVSEDGHLMRTAFVNSLCVDGKELESVADHCYETGTPGEYVVAQYFAEGTLPETLSEVELNLNVYEAPDEEGSDERGGLFTYRFQVTKEELMKDVSTVSVNGRIEAGEGLAMTVREITSTKLSNRILAECEGDPREWLDVTNYDGTAEKVENLDWCLYLTDARGNRAWCPAILYEEESGSLIFESEGGVISVAPGDTIEVQLGRLGLEDMTAGPSYVGEPIRLEIK